MPGGSWKHSILWAEGLWEMISENTVTGADIVIGASGQTLIVLERKCEVPNVAVVFHG